MTTNIFNASAPESAFTDRAGWTAYRADWRTSYAVASAEVRSARRALQAETSVSVRADLQGGLHRIRRTAAAHMLQLDAAKERKAAIMAATREPVAEAA